MENELKHITDEAKKRGHDVRIRDIAYALLRARFEDELVAYSVIFGVPEKDDDISCYEKLDSSKYLLRYFKKEMSPKEKETESSADLLALLTKNQKQGNGDGDLSFEENKAAMIELIKRTEEALEDGSIDVDKGLKILSDLRVKLNDKFKVADKEVEQYIIVQPKYNTICEHTRRECWVQTKEFAMEHWHLIPDPAYKKD